MANPTPKTIQGLSAATASRAVKTPVTNTNQPDMENSANPVIDISKYQTVSDWSKVKTAVAGVMIKATEGVGYVDPSFASHVQGAQAAGIPFGCYHFASLNDLSDPTGDATKEAQALAAACKPYKLSMPYALDLETNKSSLPPAGVLAWVNAFFAELQRLGINNYVLYSYTPFLDTNLPANHGLGNIPLWLAAYTPAPKLPKGWAKYWMWQYSSKGSIPGITGNVDLNKKG